LQQKSEEQPFLFAKDHFEAKIGLGGPRQSGFDCSEIGFIQYLTLSFRTLRNEFKRKMHFLGPT